ncbi:hypothetical protein LTR08_001493 [Meristemomyces frigidus]|nr:hypothetical protein LTR08_001493 [Meristemomyces frigidus]
MASSRSTRARQGRLTFTPLPSSSPATKGLPKRFQDRAAAVRYDGSPNPAKRRKLQPIEERATQLDGVNDELPTPAATMDRRKDAASITDDDDDRDSDSEPIRSTQRLTSRKRSRQLQLDFSNPRSSDSFSSPVRLSSSARPHSSARVGMFGTQSRRTKSRVFRIDSEESAGEGGLPSPDKLMAKSRANRNGETRPTSKEQGRVRRNLQRPINVESDEEDEDDTVVVSSGLRRGQESDLSDAEDMPTTQGRQLRRRTRRERSRDSFISSSPPRAIDSDDDLEIIEKPTMRRSRRNVDEEQEEDGEEEDDAPTTPGRRKLKQPRHLSQREKDDLAEDLDDFGVQSDVEALHATPMNTQSKQKNARQAALQQLKRKRSGQSDPVDIPDDDAGPDEAEGSFAELYNNDDDDDDEVEVIAKPTSSREMFKPDDEDADFIESDEAGDDGIIGIPDGMPIEFTQYASKKTSELFKFAIEWMVQKKINPAFQMTDEVYNLTFRKLDDKVTGLAGSKFTSAAWTPQFTLALRARPTIAFEAIERESGENWLRDKCDACNRSGHPATWQIQFQGKPYNPHTLEEVGGHDDDDEEEDSDDSNGSSSNSDAQQSDDADDQNAHDHQGRIIAPASTIYYVGKFCMANADTAHSLTHWRHHLNSWVIDWLDAQGYNTADKVVARDKLSTRKRRRMGNKIADRMEKEGVVKMLWREYSGKIDEARSSKQGRFSTGE